MRDGEFVLWESNSILQYAADKNGKSKFYPTDLKLRADVNRWLNWEGSHWFPSCYVFLVENCVKPLLGGAADPAVLAAQLDNWHKLAGILDERFSKHEWLTGKSVTIADIAVASAMHLRGWQQLPVEKHKHALDDPECREASGLGGHLCLRRLHNSKEGRVSLRATTNEDCVICPIAFPPN
jgi:glutathione S-transferase